MPQATREGRLAGSRRPPVPDPEAGAASALSVREQVTQQDVWTQPGYVRACELGSWHLKLHHRETGEEKRVTYRCRSWRHDGACSRSRAAAEFRRLEAALAPHPPELVVFMVFTMPRGRPHELAGAYRTLWRKWQSVRQWLTRTFGPCPYAATVEAHKSSWPHLNVVMVATPELARAVVEGDAYARWLIGPAKRAGFGWRLSAELARDRTAVAGYVVKLARLSHEVMKATQMPRAAPRGLRRIRSSRGFLGPLREKTPWGGELVRERLDFGTRFGVGFWDVTSTGGCHDDRDEEDEETGMLALRGTARHVRGPQVGPERFWQLLLGGGGSDEARSARVPGTVA